MGWAMDFFDMGKRVWAEFLTLGATSVVFRIPAAMNDT